MHSPYALASYYGASNKPHSVIANPPPHTSLKATQRASNRVTRTTPQAPRLTSHGAAQTGFHRSSLQRYPQPPAPRLRPAERTPADLREGLSRWQTWTVLAVACVAKNPLRQAIIEGHQISRCGRPPTLRAGWSVRRTARGPWSVANRKALLTWSPPVASRKQNTPAVARGFVGGTREQHLWWPASRWVRSDRQ